MSKTIRGKVTVNINNNTILNNMNIKSAQKRFVRLVRTKSDPYVPYLSGDLKNTAKENNKSIVYSPYHGSYIKSYAAINYYANRGMGREGLNRGGRRGRLWIPRMWANHKNEIVSEIARMLGGRPG